MNTNLSKSPEGLESTIDKVKAIWIDVLQKDDIDVQEHFLDLGGDSLSAMLCISRMRDKLGSEFSIEEFFMDGATVSNFSSIIDEGNKEH